MPTHEVGWKDPLVSLSEKVIPDILEEIQGVVEVIDLILISAFVLTLLQALWRANR